MALQLPGIQFLEGYGPAPDLVGKFKGGYDFTTGIRNEQDAQAALGDYVKSLYMQGQPQSQAAPGAPMGFAAPGLDTGTRLINGAHSAATAANDPALSAALERKMPGSTAPAGPDGAARQAMQFFVGKGYSPAQAAGIVGNLMHESGLNTGAINPGDGNDGSNSIGVAQWNGPRAQALNAFATEIGGDPNALETQLAFVEHELQGPESATRAALLAAQDPIAATKAFVGYERPQGWTPEAPHAALGFGSRARNAASLMGGDYQAGPMALMDPDSPSGAPMASTASSAGGLPPREVMAKLFANPTTRGFAAELAKAASEGRDLQPIINAGGGTLFDPNTREWLSAPGAGEPEVNFDDVSGIRKEIQQLPSYKNIAQAMPIYQSMRETAGRDSRASDLNLVYGLGKIMDPTSVVREGEMFMVQGINTLPDKLVEGINSILTGTSTLSPETRQAILKEAYGRMKGYQGALEQDTKSYTELAGRYGINPQDIIPNVGEFEEWTPEATPSGDAELDSILDKYK